jgi:hypothetical protein
VAGDVLSLAVDAGGVVLLGLGHDFPPLYLIIAHYINMSNNI